MPIRDLRALYVAIRDNEVILFDTNLKSFIDRLREIEPEIRNYQYYYRQFKLTKVIVGTDYVLQKLL